MINKHKKPTPVKAKTTTEKGTSNEPVQEEKVTPLVSDVTPEPAATPEPVATHEAAHTPTPETKVEPPAKPKPLTISNLKSELDELRTLIQTLTTQMAEVQSQLTLKRKPTANGRVQIRDKVTGKIYKSKNSVYQTMLKAGELKELVDKKIFGDVPEKNTFGVYALFRAYPDRFEEVHETEKTE
jgi:hypothetical protein